MEIGFDIALEEKQQISQSQIQSLNILAMNSMELNEFLNNEYLENPLLEYSGEDPAVHVSVELSAMYDSGNSYDTDSEVQSEETRYRPEIPWGQEETIKEYLLSQLAPGDYTKEEWRVIQYLIDCLDETGFFTVPVEEIAAKNCVSIKIVEKCLKELRLLEPYGIFAQDLKHCLLTQLEHMDKEGSDLWILIENHLEDVANGKISSITRQMKLSTAQVRKCITQLSKLNPRPLSGFGCFKTAYCIPDIIFHYEDSEWSVELNDGWMRNYKISDYYFHMMQNAQNEELKEYFKSKLLRVNFVMNSIEQRRQTITNISKKIIEKQRSYLEGRDVLVPMTMTEIAAELGIHTSTVSRAIRGKLIQYPKGNIQLKNLFSCSLPQKEEEDGVSSMYIKRLLLQTIEKENKKKPYSDQELANLLKQKGIMISRRTVAKYRDELKIKGSYARVG